MTDDKIIQLFFQRKEVAIEETHKKYGSYILWEVKNRESNYILQTNIFTVTIHYKAAEVEHYAQNGI